MNECFCIHSLCIGFQLDFDWIQQTFGHDLALGALLMGIAFKR
jgi:hypothetical protein